ncbi:MAG: ATP-binding protein [Sedimentisphaerales bacterium]|nr:ATP-binding protein [Sedimentisphaerales bacterium]
MATAQQLKALIESYTEHDPERFLSVASQIAAHAARAGKIKLSDELCKLIEEARKKQNKQPLLSRSIPIAQPSGDLSGLFSASFPKTRLSDMVLDSELKQRLERVIFEYRQVDRLHSHGLSPRRKLLLVGPSGCGKSMTASALAGELELPLLTVQFHILITKFMGETAAKLRLIFESMKQSRGIYLFDEFDAIGAHRHTGQDVGEIRRVLNSFLVFLEQDDSMSIIIAATNLEDFLDNALFRRFDDTLRYNIPTPSMTRQLIENRFSNFSIVRLNWNLILESTKDMTHADIVKACEDAAKEAVLDERKKIISTELKQALTQRRRPIINS